jgi:hypothetical protein
VLLYNFLEVSLIFKLGKRLMKTSIAVKGVIVVFLSSILATSAAHAQGAPQQVNVALSDSLSVSDAVTVSLGKVSRSVSDSLSVGDSTTPSKATAIEAAGLQAQRQGRDDKALPRIPLCL